MCPKLTELLSWNGPTVHVCCCMLARTSTKTFVSRIHIHQPSSKNLEKIFVSRKIRQQGQSLAEVSLCVCVCVCVRVSIYIYIYIYSLQSQIAVYAARYNVHIFLSIFHLCKPSIGWGQQIMYYVSILNLIFISDLHITLYYIISQAI